MLKLMIVDDSKLIRRKIAREYDSSTFSLVGNAENGIEALSIFAKYRPEVVTMDLTMPNLDGIACIEQLIEKDPAIKILVVSALNDTETGIEAIEKGAMGFINKPFSGAQIKTALAELIED